VTQLASARPFNAVTGIDNNGDGANNDRPVVDGKVIGKSVPRHRHAGRVDVRRGKNQRDGTQHAAATARVDSTCSTTATFSAARKRITATQRRSTTRSVSWLPLHGEQRDSRAGEHRSAADVPVAGAVSLLVRPTGGKRNAELAKIAEERVNR
jgi:hypothetical protein